MNYRLWAGLYAQNTRVARTKLAAFPRDRYEAVLQIASFYNLARLPGRVTVSYHDATLATLLRSPFRVGREHPSGASDSLAYERTLYHQVDHLFTMSVWAKDSIASDFGVPADKITVAGAGVNLRRTGPIAGKSYDEPAVLFVGKEFSRKGGETLLRAFSQARERTPSATLTIIGPRTIDSVPPGVRFVGNLDTDTDDGLDRLLAEYARATIFAMPSLYEPFGIAFLEAMAHALPCLASDQCAMPEIVEHERTGFSTPVGDSAQLAHALGALLESRDLRAEMGRRARERYESRFGWERAARIIQDVTQTLVPGARSARNAS